MLPPYAEQRRQIEVPHQTTQSQLFLYNSNLADEYLIGLLFKGDNEYKKQTQERHFPLHTAGRNETSNLINPLSYSGTLKTAFLLK